MKKASAAFLEVTLEEGWVARIGRSSLDNDLLTFKESFPQDWWLHAKGCPGSHVVIHHPSEAEPSKQVLEMSARLALKYSKARSTGKGTVSVCHIADISKSRGAPPGQVQLRKSKTLTVYQH